MKTVAIFGVGLIGGSFGLAIRRSGFRGTILGVSSDRTIAKARERGAIDRGAGIEEAAAEADLIFLAQPVEAILQAIPEVAQHARADALITDAGSTKAAIAEAGRKAFPGGNFLGGHPLAGKEQRGVDAAEAGLFEGRTWVLTPEPAEAIDSGRAREYLELLRGIGAKPRVVAAAEHDRILALTSHLPQIASTAFAAALAEAAGTELAEGPALFGPALVDATRLALSPFAVWGGIVETNGEEIRAALDCYIIKLQQFKDAIRGKQLSILEQEFENAARFAEMLRRTR